MTTINTDDVIARCLDLGLILDTSVKTFHKITAPTANKKCLYLAKTKSLTRIDISGFEPATDPAVVSLTQEAAKKLRLGAVRGQIFPKKAPEGSEPLLALLAAMLRVMDEEVGFKAGRRSTSDPYAQDVADADEEASQDLAA